MKKQLLLLFLFLSTLTCFAQPNVTIQFPDSGCVGKVFSFSATVSLPGDSALWYGWDFGDGSPVINTIIPNVTHQYNSAGVFDIILVVNFQTYGLYTAVAYSFIKTGTAPNAQIDVLNDTLCFQNFVQFNSLNSGSTTGWLWYFGDGATSMEQFPNHEYNIDTSGVADPFDIILTVYNNGCADTDTAIDMIAIKGPIPYFQPIFNCENRDSFAFLNLSGGADQYEWDFGDGSPVSIVTSPNHIFPGAGSYTVTLTATNSTSGCVPDTIQNIQYVPHVSSTISESGGTLYSSFSDSSYMYFWYCNGQLIPNFTGPTCVASQTGDYVVVIQDQYMGCADSSSVYSFILGIENIFENSKLSVYPNPITGNKLRIVFKKGFTNSGDLLVYSALGSLIISQPLSLSLTEIDFEIIPAGIYFMTIRIGSDAKTFKLIRK